MSVELYKVEEVHVVIREESDIIAFADLMSTLHNQPRSVGFLKNQLKDSHRDIIAKIVAYIDTDTKDEQTNS